MSKITIEKLYRGEKYDIMSAVEVKAMTLCIDERTKVIKFNKKVSTAQCKYSPF